ncbi:unnamed protein product [Schistosoma mattheei]|uniref:MSP domain-containing protein n=2 Tax=Schistosoma TaxID=6181 RepID=A0A183KS38_9TREM|nr:unnamed protein product [Schistosoma curassoni]VDP87333.1 unnamed protein product [Schistosoma mattheei]
MEVDNNEPTAVATINESIVGKKRYFLRNVNTIPTRAHKLVRVTQRNP